MNFGFALFTDEARVVESAQARVLNTDINIHVAPTERNQLCDGPWMGTCSPLSNLFVLLAENAARITLAPT